MLLTDLPPDLITLIATWVPIRTLRPVVRFDALAPRPSSPGKRPQAAKAQGPAPRALEGQNLADDYNAP